MEYIAVLSPLVGALVAGLFGKQIGDKGAQFVTCALMLAAAIASVMLLREVNYGDAPRTIELFTWIASGDLNVKWALRFDQLSAVMAVVITVVSTMVHFYSVGYMHHDPAQGRFMAYLSLFTFAMLMLVTADNFVQLFFGWEGVGLASYLLIGFWNQKDSANAAAIKAFVMNRIGDFGLALGIFAVFLTFGTLNFDGVFEQIAAKTDDYSEFLGYHVHTLSLIGVLLFIGAMGKSAQLGLHTWLPDAMEGPTPVSALIHAATMVTAGVFLVARMSPLYEFTPEVRDFIAIVGACTAFVAATIALTQFDIKRVIAYSTMSQLGYMFFALGVSAYGAAMFHLFTHAFFKALLFLGAGSVIHAMSDEQDMRRMGGIWKMIPFTYAMMWIGSLALAGVPVLAGFYSKDMILEAAFAAHSPVGAFAFWMGIAAAFMTAFYSWRLIFMTFHGKPRADEKVMDHVHESPLIMTVPLAFLAVGAVAAGMVFAPHFIGELRGDFWGAAIQVLAENDTVERAHHVPTWVKILPIATGASGILLAFVFYMRARHWPAEFAGRFSRLHGFLFNKWYFDELYTKIGVKPSFALGRFFWKTGDGATIDGLGPDGVSKLVSDAAQSSRKVQSGFIYHYAFAMLIGVVAIVTFFLYKAFG
ncbi:MAG: NADH-quinone oxidoreductase subunit L [Bdellovibrionales bacterium]|jgi:NADH-quinone oxidoreductase subunit L|nr:NADH-quinone oxidoreductase subunit L [Bdellovibrionales bacterium]